MKIITKAVFLVAFLVLNIWSSEGLNAQNLEIVSTDLNSRDLITMQFPVNNAQSSSRVVLSSGDGNLESFSDLASWSLGYTAVSGYAGFTGFSNGENGIVIRATGANGKVRFLSGGIDVITHNRMTITPNGNIGIGTDNAASRVQVENGDVYLKGLGSGLIMKSPNGNCWNMTVSNAGTTVFSSIPYP